MKCKHRAAEFGCPAHRPAAVWRRAPRGGGEMSPRVFHMIAGAPTPVAPFSHAVEIDGWLFVTGQMPTWPDDDRRPLPEGVEAQTRRVMDNLVLVLNGVGYGLAEIVSVRVFLPNFE